MTYPITDISVVICAYTENRWNDLVAAVASLQQQTLLPREIIIVIDHNPNLLEQVRKQLPDVIAVGNREVKGLSGARNTGAMVAQGVVIAFLDDDALAEPNWIECLSACYADPHVVGVGGRIKPLWLGTRPFWFPDEFNWVVGCTYRGMPSENTPVRNIIGANMSVQRHILIAVGGFRESFGCNHNSIGNNTRQTYRKWLQHRAGDEETEFCIRVAQQLPNSTWLYTPEATVRHRVPVQRTRWTYFMWRCYDEGLGKASVVRLHGMQVGLSSERAYVYKILPSGVLRGVVDALIHYDMKGLVRAGAIMSGFVATISGYLVGCTFSKITESRNSLNVTGDLRHDADIPFVEKKR